MIGQVPTWVKDAIFYQIFPERFARSERLTKPANLESWESPPTRRGFKGGDFLGMLEHLDYLEDLGVNAIYFNPIFQSAANHRYHTHDYYTVDPDSGRQQGFRPVLGSGTQSRDAGRARRRLQPRQSRLFAVQSHHGKRRTVALPGLVHRQEIPPARFRGKAETQLCLLVGQPRAAQAQHGQPPGARFHLRRSRVLAAPGH